MNSHANNIPPGAYHHKHLAQPHPHGELFTVFHQERCFFMRKDAWWQESLDTAQNFIQLHYRKSSQFGAPGTDLAFLRGMKKVTAQQTSHCYISFPFPAPLCASSKLYPWPSSLLLNIYVRNCENRLISVCPFSLSFSETC